MYKARVLAAGMYPEDGATAYEVAGDDGIHPGWAGHTIMAYAFLKAMGLDGDLGTISVNLQTSQADASAGHQVESFENGALVLRSARYPFCATGPVDDDDSIRSGMTLVPFDHELNRLTLKVEGFQGIVTVKWGDTKRTYSAGQLANGINLPAEFIENPFCKAFDRVDQAVGAKQAFETRQIKSIFHGPEGRADIEDAVARTEAERKPLVDAIHAAQRPVVHRIEFIQ